MADTGFSHTLTPPILLFIYLVTRGQQKASSVCISDLVGNVTYLCSKGITSSHSSTVQVHKDAKMAAVGKKNPVSASEQNILVWDNDTQVSR